MSYSCMYCDKKFGVSAILKIAFSFAIILQMQLSRRQLEINVPHGTHYQV